MRQIRFVDWFAGIGGFRHGLEKANSKVGIHRQPNSYARRDSPNLDVDQQDGETPGGHGAKNAFNSVGACELDQYARQIYAKNFGHEPQWGDSQAVDPSELPDFDLFCAGFSCKGLSMAGNRLGFEHPETRTFYEIPRICGAKKPSYILLENVEGFLSHNKGRTFEIALATLDQVGYDLQWEVLNSRYFGVPQNRNRVFIIGHLRGIPRPQVFPLGEDAEMAGIPQREKGEEITSACLRAHGSGGHGDAEMTVIQMEHRTKGKPRFYEGEIPTMLQDYGTGGQNVPLVVLNRYPHGEYHEGELPNAIGQGVGRPGNAAAPVIRAEHHNTADVHFIPEGTRLRRLTPLECERLQGFPDGWTEGVSDTQRYKCLGNAVTVTVIEAIGERLLKAIRDTET